MLIWGEKKTHLFMIFASTFSPPKLFYKKYTLIKKIQIIIIIIIIIIKFENKKYIIFEI
jgi:hypothetical protein